ncbi:MAG: hypothetical protein K2X52_06315 [Mycobacteriaceae bacterium]|nr:hypothetical protein [Mycobacteriaceae bacterium]
MDTIVFGTGMPCVLAFLDHDIDDVAATWESWVQTGRFVRARHDDPTRDAVIGFLPAAIGAVEFVPHDPAGRQWPDRMLWSNPHLQAHTNAADLPPEKAHYWTLNPVGFSARFETLPDGSRGLILGHWEPGRL